MKRLEIVLWTAAVAVTLTLLAAPAGANPADSPVQYSVKYVCGFVAVQPPGEESAVKPGNYATAVNIHNYTSAVNVPAQLRVTVHYREGVPLPPIFDPVKRRAYRYRTLEIDCPDIWRILSLPPGTFVKGMLHIGLPQPLPIAAVYTSQTNLDPAGGVDAGAGMSIDVEYIKPFIEMPPM